MNNPATAAIEFAINRQTDEPISFLRCWYEGDFETIRKEWPDAPDAVFIGADPLLNQGCGSLISKVKIEMQDWQPYNAEANRPAR